MSTKNGFSLLSLLVIGSIIIFTFGGIFLISQKSISNISLPKISSKNQVKSDTRFWMPQSKHPWPMFHGNYNHIGYVAVSGPQKGNLKWKFFVGKTEGRWPNSMSISSDGVTYVAGGDKLTAVDKNGKEIWSKSYPKSQGPAIGDDGTIYFVADDSIIAVKSQGEEKWKFKTGGNSIFGPTIGPDGTIYQGSWDKYFYAIKPDGTLKWKYQTKGAVSYPASIGEDGTIYLGGGDAHAGPDGDLYAFDPSGNLKWKYDTGSTRVGSPAVTSDTIYLPAAPTLFAIDLNGNLKWKMGPNVGSVQGISVIAQSSCGSPPLPPCRGQEGNQNQQAGQAFSGSARQGASQDKGDIAGIITPAISPDGAICIGTSEGKILNIDPNAQVVKWSYKSGQATTGQNAFGLPSFPVVDQNGVCYQGSVDGYMYAIDKDGELKWKYQTQGPITEAAEAIGPDGTLYFTSEDGYLYAIGD